MSPLSGCNAAAVQYWPWPDPFGAVCFLSGYSVSMVCIYPAAHVSVSHFLHHRILFLYRSVYISSQSCLSAYPVLPEDCFRGRGAISWISSSDVGLCSGCAAPGILDVQEIQHTIFILCMMRV